MRVILVIAAHPDDEAIGCGGTIAKHIAQGHQVNIVYMSDGVASRTGSGKAENEARRAAAKEAQQILKINDVFFLEFPDNRMDSVPLLDIVQALEPIIEKIRPEVIYTHHYGDLNIDHRVTHQATMTACRPQPGTSVKEIYSFEVMSSTEWASLGNAPFLPSCYVDISDFLALKIKVAEAYLQEMRAVPHSRSLDHLKQLAHHRGASVGTIAAEAFTVVRYLR